MGINQKTLRPLPRELLKHYFILQCVKLSPSTSAKLVSKLVTPAGNFTVSSTAFSPMDKCLPIRLSEAETTLSTPSSPKPELESTSHVASSSTSSLPLLTKFVPELTVNSSTLSS